MITDERLLTILRTPLFSEKSTIVHEKNNTIVFKVNKNATKPQIKLAIQKLFDVEVTAVRTLVTKGKVKRRGSITGRRSDWKKAYITLKENQNIDLSGKVQ